jgi:hypothetical protein
VPRITNPNTTHTTRTGGATGTTGPAGTTGPQDTGTARPASWSPPPLRSASGSVIQPKRVVVDGLQGGQMNATNTSSRFSRDTAFDGYSASGDGRVNRAFIKVDAEPLHGGCRLNVKSFHAQKDDVVTLWLTAEVLDAKTNQLRTITLSTLSKGDVINPGSFRGDLHFDINYADVNKYLQAMNPNLKLNPGHTSLAVAARWSNGHQAGGFGRGGVFRLPNAGRPTSVVDVRAARAETDEADLPLDMQVAFPPSVATSIPQLKPDGNILSRLESELKGTASKQEMTAAVTKMYDLVAKANAGDAQAVESALGKDWSVKTVSRYWLKDDGSAGQVGKPGDGLFKGFRVDDDGLPMQDPMRDQYMDDANLGMTKLEGAVRLRKNKQATVINVKPGGGREDSKTSIRQRVEYGLEMKPDASVNDAARALQTLSRGRWSGTVFNQAQREVAKLEGDVHLSSALDPWLEVTQDRHKFTVFNEKTGVEIEFSFDKVQTKTMRPELANADGTPREAEFYVLEAELDHLQLQSANATTVAMGGDVNATHFSADDQQTKWLSETSDMVTMDIDPRLHELKDLDNASFRSTTSYKQFEGASAKIIPWLFPNGLGHGRQKAAHAADVLGLVHFTDDSLRDAISDVFKGSGYVWNDQLKQAFDQGMQDPSTRRRLENGLLDGASRNPFQYARNTIGEQALTFDIPKIKQRVSDTLKSLGYDSTPEIEKMFDGVNQWSLAPRTFESQLRKLDDKRDADMMAAFAKLLRTSPAPAPRPNVAHILGPSSSYGVKLRDQLEKADLDGGLAPALEKLYEAAAAAGVPISTIRSSIRSFSRSPAQAVKKIATAAGGNVQTPELHHDADKLVREAADGLSTHYLQMTPELEAFIRNYAATHDYKEANKFLTSFKSKPGPTLEKAAKADGVTAPALKYDLAQIDALLSRSFVNHKIDNGQELLDFAHKALEGGLTVKQLNNAYRRLNSTSDLAKAFKGARVDVSAFSLPTLKYDRAATLGWLQQTTTSRLGGYIEQGAPLSNYLDKLLALGLTPNQAVNYTTYAFSSGRRDAANSYTGGLDPKSLPSLPVDFDAVKAELKKNFGASWSPAHEQYVDANLQDALDDSPGFRLNSLVTRWNPREGLIHLGRCTKTKLPDSI